MTLAQLLLLLDQHVEANRVPDAGNGPAPSGGQRMGTAADLLALAQMRRG